MNYSNHFRAIHPKAQIGSNCTILPFTYIEEDVVIGDNCWIGSNVNIHDGARIGDNCKVFPGAAVSGIPQDLKYKGETTHLHLGNASIVRECCTLNKGTAAACKTVIGEECLLMAYTHVAHDCVIGDKCILANNTTLAGHVEIGYHATLGGMTAVQQFTRIGDHVMINGGSKVRKDVPPFILAARDPVAYEGVNSVGLKRRNFTTEEIHHIEDIYRILFLKGLNTTNALEMIESEIKPSGYREQILDFVRLGMASERGMIRGHRFKSNGLVGQINGSSEPN